MAAAKSDRLNVRLSLLVTDEGENAKCAAPTFAPLHSRVVSGQRKAYQAPSRKLDRRGNHAQDH